MKRNLLVLLITAVFAAPAAYAQGTTPPKDTGMTKDRPAAGGSASTKADAGMKGGGASTSAKADAGMKGKDGKSPDAVITGKIKAGFIKDKIVRSRNYNVDTRDGMVTLKGKARSQAELDRAIEIAKKTEGVKDVKSEVQLMASADAGSAKAGAGSSASGTSKAGSGTSAAGGSKADAKKDASATPKGSAAAK